MLPWPDPGAERAHSSIIWTASAAARNSPRLTRLWNYERYGAPLRRGDLYVYSYNDGLMNQPQVLMQRAWTASRVAA